MPFVLALDQGTTSSRAIVFDEAGAVRAMAQAEFRQIFPQPGWVEHDPEEIWRTQLHVAQEALANARIAARDLAAIGITNQRETTVLWDRASGAPLANAIVWQDRRTADHCARLKREGHAARVTSKTGLVLDPYFSATKLAWLLDHVPGARSARSAASSPSGRSTRWLAWKLTGGGAPRHRSDERLAHAALRHRHRRRGTTSCSRSSASRARCCPRCGRRAACYGATEPQLFGAPVPIAGIAGDQQAALFGQACHSPGMAKNTYGTGCFMLLNTGASRIESRHGLLTTRAASQRGAPSSRSKAASSSPARSCSGCATGWA